MGSKVYVGSGRWAYVKSPSPLEAKIFRRVHPRNIGGDNTACVRVVTRRMEVRAKAPLSSADVPSCGADLHPSPQLVAEHISTPSPAQMPCCLSIGGWYADKIKKIKRKFIDYFFAFAYNKGQKEVLIMAQTVNVNFKLDEDVKKRMEQVCSELGLSMSAAFTIFAKKVSREHRIPFEVSVDPFYSESNIRYLENLNHEVKSGKAHFEAHDLIEVD